MARRHAPQPAGPGAEKLRRGLCRRGFALSDRAGRGARARSASASVSSLLCDSTTRAAIAFAARHAAEWGARRHPPRHWPRRSSSTMLLHKLKLTALSLCCSWPSSPPASAVSPARPRSADETESERPPEPRLRSRPSPTTRPRARPGRMTVVGRVLDPQGKPVPNASVMVYGALKQAGGRARRRRTRGDRPGGLRRLGPVPARCAADLVGDALHGRRRGDRARATAPAGSTWTSTPTSLPPTSRSGPSR